MDKISEDRGARLEFLATWGAQQQRRLDAGKIAAPRREPRGLYERALEAVAICSERTRAHLLRLIEPKLDRLDRVFDRGLDTSRPVIYTVPEGALVDGRPYDGRSYVPSRWYILPLALRAVRASKRDVLVDFGCGKGRIVHQAAKRRLKRVIGVEISPELAAFARALVTAHRREYRCQSVEIVVCDAARFPVPDDLTIAYLYAPFAKRTLDAVLDNLIESIDRHPRTVHLICVGLPVQECTQVLATRRFQVVRDIRFDNPTIYTAIFESCE